MGTIIFILFVVGILSTPNIGLWFLLIVAITIILVVYHRNQKIKQAERNAPFLMAANLKKTLDISEDFSPENWLENYHKLYDHLLEMCKSNAQGTINGETLWGFFASIINSKQRILIKVMQNYYVSRVKEIQSNTFDETSLKKKASWLIDEYLICSSDYNKETKALSKKIINQICKTFNYSFIDPSYDDYFLDNFTTSKMDFDNMEGTDFELFCSNLLRKNGFSNVALTKASGDQGVDITAEKEDIKYAFQCKCYSYDLGNTPIQEVHAGKYVYNCQIGVVMTNRHFTNGAIELAKSTGTLLWDREKIISLMGDEETIAEYGQHDIWQYDDDYPTYYPDDKLLKDIREPREKSVSLYYEALITRNKLTGNTVESLKFNATMDKAARFYICYEKIYEYRCRYNYAQSKILKGFKRFSDYIEAYRYLIQCYDNLLLWDSFLMPLEASVLECNTSREDMISQVVTHLQDIFYENYFEVINNKYDAGECSLAEKCIMLESLENEILEEIKYDYLDELLESLLSKIQEEVS